jgi:hypothetical protein
VGGGGGKGKKIADERRDSDVEREAIGRRGDKGEKALAPYIAEVR